MTSGNFRSVPIDSITVDRPERQRRELKNVEELALSIHKRGLIHPIVIDSDHILIAGERRLTACRSLGWTAITAQFIEELDVYERQMIELEENLKREDLPWQDEVAALERLHRLKMENEDDWSQAKTAEYLGMSDTDVGRKLAVAKEMPVNETVASAERFSAAANMVARNAERKKTSVLDSVSKLVAGAALSNEDGEADEEAGTEVSPPVVPLLNTSFHDWQENYDGPKFNLIHCDFPYGINVADAPRMDATIKDHYADSPDIYWALLARLGLAMGNVVADSAHLIFWFSMDYYADTLETLTRMGWKVNPFPLIWYKSDGAGIAPDPQRGPRRVYETALLASRGDRLITQEGCVANVYAHPGRRDDAIHISEKPMPMLRHFMRMVCDEYSMVLDPTCGSANALKVAEGLGATSVLGLEQSADFHETAVLNWDKRDA